MLSFTIPYPTGKRAKQAFTRRFGLNAYYAGKHWAQRGKDAEYIHFLARKAMENAGIEKKILPKPVAMTFLFNDRLDCSNHAAIVKMVEDAMKGWVIRDDGRSYVKAITMGFHEEDCIRVEVSEL